MSSFDNHIQCDEFNGEDWDEYQQWLDGELEDEDWDDGQPDEYTEWQDFYGGDDWDHGQYDEY